MSPAGGVVIVGGGPAGLATARAFREAGGERAGHDPVAPSRIFRTSAHR